jgi:Fe-S-cluster containining protein
MLQLKQFVPQEVCLACQGCCRYAEKETVWQPFFMIDEITELTGKGILPACVFTHEHSRKGKGACINLVRVGDSFFCPCLEIQENKCKIYKNRPLDCQLYPFLLVHKEDRAFLAADRKCPYIQKMRKTLSLDGYIRYLLEFLSSQDFISLADHNPEIFQIYGEDAEFLAPLPGLRPRLYGTEAARPG